MVRKVMAAVAARCRARKPTNRQSGSATVSLRETGCQNHDRTEGWQLHHSKMHRRWLKRVPLRCYKPGHLIYLRRREPL